MTKTKTLSLAAFLLALFGASAAQAAEIDFSPLVNAGLEYVLVPLLGMLAAYIAAQLAVLAKRVAARYPALIDQQTSALLAQNIDALLHKAISYGAVQAQQSVNSVDLRGNVDGWIASYAAQYAVDHAPDLAKQAGDITQKVFSRLASHPDVQELKATLSNPPLDLQRAAAA